MIGYFHLKRACELSLQQLSSSHLVKDTHIFNLSRIAA